jgi:hypothetical protein
MCAFLAFHAKNQAFRSNSSDLPMQILWDFRCNPLRPTGCPRFARPCMSAGGTLKRRYKK